MFLFVLALKKKTERIDFFSRLFSRFLLLKINDAVERFSMLPFVSILI